MTWHLSPRKQIQPRCSQLQWRTPWHLFPGLAPERQAPEPMPSSQGEKLLSAGSIFMTAQRTGSLLHLQIGKLRLKEAKELSQVIH